jgi:hypothetical protein
MQGGETNDIAEELQVVSFEWSLKKEKVGQVIK